jgi:HSP20 family protein
MNLELRAGNELRITGESGQRERGGTVRRQNRRTGQFEYVIALPGDVEADQVEASLQGGVLMVRLGKWSDSARPARTGPPDRGTR